MTPSPKGRLFSKPKLCERCRTKPSIGWKESGSTKASMRSRAVILPLACCLSIAALRLPAASARRALRIPALPAVVRRSAPCGSFGSWTSLASAVMVTIPPTGSDPAYLSRVSSLGELDPHRVQELLRTSGCPWPAPHYVDSTASTNADALAAARAGAVEGACFVAGEQTAGRGRHGRTWVSDPGAGLWCSTVLAAGLEATRV